MGLSRRGRPPVRRDRCRAGRLPCRAGRRDCRRWSVEAPSHHARRNARRRTSSNRLLSRRSSSATRPSGRTKRLPPCGRRGTPEEVAPSRNTMSRARTTALVSMPARCIPATCPSRSRPGFHDQDRRVTSSGGGGHDYRLLARAGQDGGDVEHVVSLEAGIHGSFDDGLGEHLHQGGRVGRDATGIRPIRWGQPSSSGDVRRHQVRHWGRCTLTTTSSPLRRRAAWTWAIRARLWGWSRSDRRRPRGAGQVSLDHRRTASKRSAGTRSRSNRNSPRFGREHAFAGGKDSGRA